MPAYLNLLRDASTFSIYVLFLIVLFFRVVKGKIDDNNLKVFTNIWLPLAVIAQISMTFVRKHYGTSNIPIANVFIMLELPVLVYILLRIRKKLKNTDINYKVWLVLIVISILLHLFEDFYSIQKEALLLTVIIYFQLTVSSVDIEDFDMEINNKFYQNPLLLLNAGIFLKAFGYSFFLIYQIDYKFPLSIYSLVNLGVQILFVMVIIFYYKNNKRKNFQMDR